MGLVWLLVRVVAGAVTFFRGARRLADLEGSAGELAHVGFRSPRRVAAAIGALQVVAGLMLMAGLLVPIAAGVVLAISMNGVSIRRSELGWAHPETIVDVLLLAAGVVLGFVAPGPLALDRILDWEVGGGALGVLALVLGALGGAVGTQLRDTRIVKARREGTDAEEARGLERPPVEPLGPREATDPGQATEGDGPADPRRARDARNGRSADRAG